MLGFAFTELTYRLAGRGYMLFYLLSLPLKLFFFALVLYACYALIGASGFLSCLSGFLLGFFLSLIIRGFLRDGRPEGA